MSRPLGYDPHLQDKVDMICNNNAEWVLMNQIEKTRDSISYNERLIRAMENEIRRSRCCLEAMELTLENLQKMEKKK